MLQLLATDMLCFQIKNNIRDAQNPQPWEKSMNSMRLDVKMYTFVNLSSKEIKIITQKFHVLLLLLPQLVQLHRRSLNKDSVCIWIKYEHNIIIQ